MSSVVYYNITHTLDQPLLVLASMQVSPFHSSVCFAFAPSARSSTQTMAKPRDRTSWRDDDGGGNDDDRTVLDERGKITMLGFGSLLSLNSARVTFPDLENFRLGRVPNHRRVFAHPASIFFERGIANIDTLEMGSLSCEYEEGASFVCSVFEVLFDPEWSSSTSPVGLGVGASSEGGGAGGGGLSNAARRNDWIPSRAFLEREEEFEIAMVPFEEMPSSSPSRADHHDDAETRTITTARGIGVDGTSSMKMGVICRRSTDEAYISLWGRDHFERKYLKYGVETIWDWSEDSGLRPCPAYLRHCVLASWNAGGDNGGDSWSDMNVAGGGVCYDSFLDETYLVDRATTIREYLTRCPDIMKIEPPEELRERYGG
jgi:hypothetical protein